MGRLDFVGAAAERWVDRLITADVPKIPVGKARYGFLCNQAGGVLDDLIVYRLEDRVFLVVNAGNRQRVVEWFEQHREDADAELHDVSEAMAMVAIQGPRSTEIVDRVMEDVVGSLADLPYYQITTARFAGQPARIATTGYTGEHGFEVFVSTELAEPLWMALQDVGGDAVQPIGLGARDTLRIEAGMPLYGHELSESINPYEAGLGPVVKLGKETSFIGRDALLQIREQGAARKLVGLRVQSKRIARQGMKILQDGQPIGEVTSGIPSPTLGYPVAMGLIDSKISSGDGLEVDVRGTRVSVVPETMPFYSAVRKKAVKAW
jgi:aminomethyltransferase